MALGKAGFMFLCVVSLCGDISNESCSRNNKLSMWTVFYLGFIRSKCNRYIRGSSKYIRNSRKGGKNSSLSATDLCKNVDSPTFLRKFIWKLSSKDTCHLFFRKLKTTHAHSKISYWSIGPSKPARIVVGMHL